MNTASTTIDSVRQNLTAAKNAVDELRKQHRDASLVAALRARINSAGEMIGPAADELKRMETGTAKEPVAAKSGKTQRVKGS